MPSTKLHQSLLAVTHWRLWAVLPCPASVPFHVSLLTLRHLKACSLAYASAGVAGNTSGNAAYVGSNLALASFTFQVLLCSISLAYLWIPPSSFCPHMTAVGACMTAGPVQSRLSCWMAPYVSGCRWLYCLPMPQSLHSPCTALGPALWPCQTESCQQASSAQCSAPFRRNAMVRPSSSAKSRMELCTIRHAHVDKLSHHAPPRGTTGETTVPLTPSPSEQLLCWAVHVLIGLATWGTGEVRCTSGQLRKCRGRRLAALGSQRLHTLVDGGCILPGGQHCQAAVCPGMYMATAQACRYGGEHGELCHLRLGCWTRALVAQGSCIGPDMLGGKEMSWIYKC